MPSHGQVAAGVRRQKEAHPELFCRDPRCLWRSVLVTRDKRVVNRPCPKHETREAEVSVDVRGV